MLGTTDAKQIGLLYLVTAFAFFVIGGIFVIEALSVAVQVFSFKVFRRRVLLMVRETPLSLAHLRNMVSVTEMGGIVMPPVPALYQRPDSINAMVTDTAQHALQLLGLPNAQRKEWQGLRSS